MSRYLQIADNQAMSTNLFPWTEYPSEIRGLENVSIGNALGALDGEGIVQYRYADNREFEIIFDTLTKSIFDANDNTLLKELRDRLFETTGSEYYMRLTPEKTGTGTWASNKITVSDGEMSIDAYIGMDIVDAAYNAFYITDNDATTITVNLDGGTATNGAFYVVRRDVNPLDYSPPMKVRINNIVLQQIPNDNEIIYEMVLKMQRCS